MRDDCIFCRIARGEAEAQVVFEDGSSIAFLDINPLTEGHTMVVPKAHYQRLEDVPAEEVGSLFRTVHRVASAARDALGAPATTVGINNGEVAGQVVPHVHVHVVPRYAGDGGGTIHTIVRSPGERDLAAVRRILARAFGA